MMQRLLTGVRLVTIACSVVFMWRAATIVTADERPVAAAQRTWVWSRNLASEESQKLFPITNASAVHEMAVSPDAKTFAYSGLPAGNSRNQRVRIWTCDAKGGNVRDLGCGTMPSWSPRGKRLVFSRSEPEAGVWIMRADGSDQKILDAQGWGASWSPDGRQIAWLKPIGGKLNVVLHNVAEDDFDVVATDEEFAAGSHSGQLKWSPDNTRLCLVIMDSAGAARLVTFNAAPPADLRRLSEKQRSFKEPVVWLNKTTILHESQQYAVNGSAADLRRQSIQNGPLLSDEGVVVDVSRDSAVLFYLKRSSE